MTIRNSSIFSGLIRVVCWFSLGPANPHLLDDSAYLYHSTMSGILIPKNPYSPTISISPSEFLVALHIPTSNDSDDSSPVSRLNIHWCEVAVESASMCLMLIIVARIHSSAIWKLPNQLMISASSAFLIVSIILCWTTVTSGKIAFVSSVGAVRSPSIRSADTNDTKTSNVQLIATARLMSITTQCNEINRSILMIAPVVKFERRINIQYIYSSYTIMRWNIFCTLCVLASAVCVATDGSAKSKFGAGTTAGAAASAIPGLAEIDAMLRTAEMAAELREKVTVRTATTTSDLIRGEGFKKLDHCLLHNTGTVERADLPKVFDGLISTGVLGKFDEVSNNTVGLALKLMLIDILEKPYSSHVHNMGYVNEKGRINMFFMRAEPSAVSKTGVRYEFYIIDANFTVSPDRVKTTSSYSNLVRSEYREDLVFFPGDFTDAHIDTLFKLTNQIIGMFTNKTEKTASA